jgi:para-nitrobenzyl esterase
MFGVDAFVCIPYAAPPRGALRWTPPQPPAHFTGVFKAIQFGNRCTQSGPGLSSGSAEDCLTLNVFRPIQKYKHHLIPVMVFIHGGGLVTGSSIDYDPSPWY